MVTRGRRRRLAVCLAAAAWWCYIVSKRPLPLAAVPLARKTRLPSLLPPAPPDTRRRGLLIVYSSTPRCLFIALLASCSVVLLARAYKSQHSLLRLRYHSSVHSSRARPIDTYLPTYLPTPPYTHRNQSNYYSSNPTEADNQTQLNRPQ
ncbi:uncharacterized protein K452DRAFT_25241 [Aplosporella prunicola CBS 121167]|uniref:Uncharacterized protein n=1 Tax=Aplosporella prunicola CBS 121167 TaxID=1176127 RepID=A0A6A6BDB8_9PEZI|nr:uncharacterized protein K452DRAFT_25241 [Aplosporella prunicola CBS 121167]KAF2142046.1 hypothetical protein K452DRAFT_25241 [Aplosporella prunicola CBS 121167]